VLADRLFADQPDDFQVGLDRVEVEEGAPNSWEAAMAISRASTMAESASKPSVTKRWGRPAAPSGLGPAWKLRSRSWG
jgi:hypothetical protein